MKSETINVQDTDELLRADPAAVLACANEKEKELCMFPASNS